MVSETVGLHRSKARESPFKSKAESQDQGSDLHSSDSSDNEEVDIRQTNHERKLLAYLMRDYDKSIRPVRDAKSPVVIKLGITLTQIVDLVSDTRPTLAVDSRLSGYLSPAYHVTVPCVGFN